MEAAMKGMLEPVYEEVVIGQAEVRKTYKVSKIGTIAGCMVTEGKIRGNVSLKDDASEKRTLADKLQGLMKNHTPVRHTAQA